MAKVTAPRLSDLVAASNPEQNRDGTDTLCNIYVYITFPQSESERQKSLSVCEQRALTFIVHFTACPPAASFQGWRHWREATPEPCEGSLAAGDCSAPVSGFPGADGTNAQ